MSKTVLITGGARGIGRAIATEFARDHDVVVTWRHTKPDVLPDGIHTVEADLTEADTFPTAPALPN